MNRTQSKYDKHREVLVLDKIKYLEIDVRYIEAMINANSHQAYHNIQHLYTVALRAFSGGIYHEFGFRQQRVLFLAALLHDIAHTGSGDVCDSVNVEISSNTAKSLLKNDNSFTDQEKNLIVELILGTDNYNHVSSQNKMQHILNDADIMQVFEDDLDVWIDRLTDEKQENITIESSIQFLESQTPLSEWGAGVFKRNIPRLKSLVFPGVL